MSKLITEEVARRLLNYDADFANEEVNSALSKVRPVLQEKLAAGESVEDDLADFSVIALMAAENFDDDHDGVMVRVMLEEIWHEEEEDGYEEEEADDDEDDD